MSDFDSSLPVRTLNAGDVVAKIADSTIPSQQLKVEADGSINVNATFGSASVQITDGSDTLAVNSDGSINSVVTATNLDIRDLVFASDKVDVSGSSVSISGSVAVTATNLDIRDLTFANDKVDVSGSSVTVSATNLDIRDLAFATDKVDASGSSVSVTGTVAVTSTDLDIRNLAFATDKVDASGSTVGITGTVDVTGSSVAVTATNLDIRDLAFATDKVDASGSNVSVSNTVTVQATNLDVRDLTFASDKVDVSGSSVTVSATDLDIRNLVFATDKVDASGSSVTISGTPTVQANNLDIRDLVFATDKVDASGSSVSVSNTVTVQANNLDVRDLAFATDKVDVSGSSVTVSATDLDIRNLSALQDSVKISNGTTDLAIAADGSISVTEQPRTLNASGSAAANNTDIIASTDVSAYRSITVHVTGTFAGVTAQAQFSNDNVNWLAANAVSLLNATTAPTQNLATTNTLFKVPVQGRFFRLRTTAYTSGTINAAVHYSADDIVDLSLRNVAINGTPTVNATITPIVLNVTGTGAALNATPIAATTVNTYDVAMLQLTGTWSATLVAEGSNDAVTWVTVPVQQVDTSFVPPTYSMTANGMYKIPLQFNSLRVRVSSFTSGTVTANARISLFDSEGLAPGISTISGSVAVTATDLDIRDLAFATDKVDVTGSTVSVGNTVNVSSTNLDIRDLTFAADKVDVSGSSVTIIGTPTVQANNLDIRDLAFASDKVDVSGSSVTVSATNLDVRDLVFATDKVDVSGSSVTVSATDLDVRNLTFATDKVDASGSTVTVTATNLDVRDLAFASDKVDVTGSTVGITGTVSVSGSSVTVSATNLDIRDLTHATDSVKIGDGSDFLAVNSDGSINVVPQEDAGTERVDYSTAAAIAAGASSNHDYIMTNASKLYQVWASASGKLKIEVQVETGSATGVFNTVAVGFNSTANPNIDLRLAKYRAVPAGARVRVIRTNKDNQAQDLYSTIVALES